MMHHDAYPGGREIAQEQSALHWTNRPKTAGSQIDHAPAGYNPAPAQPPRIFRGVCATFLARL
jgi:hypothetical protein